MAIQEPSATSLHDQYCKDVLMNEVSEFQLAEEVGSISTCPHRESELAARVAEHPSQSVYVHRILSSRQRGDYAQPPLSVSLQNLSVADFAPATRFVLSPSPTLAGSLSKELDLTPLRCKGILGDIYTVAQSSKEAWFNFNSPHLSFRLYYDPASDNLVFMNLGKSLLRLDSMKKDHTRDDSKGYLVLPRQPTQITPGLWRVSFRENKGAPRMDLCDFLLLRRRYCVEISRSTQETGSKRRLSMPDSQRKKRHLDDDDRSLVLINVTPIKGPKNARLTIARDGNPFQDIEPGQCLAIVSSDQPASKADSSLVDTTRTKISEQYSISNMRDIINTAATSIFYGRHSIHGLIAVKFLRQKPAVLGPAVHTFAQYWENEKRLLQNVDHPSIIKFVGADARFFSIYMESLPYPDLTGMMSRPGYMFTGTTDDATRVLRDMASALEHLAVEKKLLHNDIKPGNILYDPARGAVLVDFGLGSSEAEKTCKGGTPWYVPREFMVTGKRGFESDIFALGVTLLYLLNKTPLPELHCKGWIIARVAEDKIDRSRMERWIQEVIEMRSQLADDGIELLVKQMIDEDPEHRISAASLVRRTQNLARL